MNKKIDMTAFVGTDFDCECQLAPFPDWQVKPFLKTDPNRIWRPRLNKPQVLNSWDWVPDGLVWEVTSYPRSMSPQYSTSNILCSVFLRHASNENVIIYAACIGVTPEYALDGKRLGMEVIDV